MALIRPRATRVVAASALGVLGMFVVPAGSAMASDPIAGESAPTLQSPASETSTPIKDVVLRWSSVQYASGYQVQISPNGDWTNDRVDLPNSGKTVTTVYEVPLSLPYDEYFWRVRAFDAGGHTAWSSPRQFLHEWADPMTILRDPTAGDPTVAWAPVPEASLYRVRFSTDQFFREGVKVCWTASNELTPYTLQTAGESLGGECYGATALVDGTTYYYEVAAFDDSTAPVIGGDTTGDAGFECAEAQPACDALTIGAVGSFTYDAPDASTVSGSVTGLATRTHSASLPGTACTTSTPCPASPTFSWNAVSGANAYEVQVCRDPLCVNVYRIYDTQWPHVTPRDGLLDAQAGQAYYWRVLAGTCTSDVITTCPDAGSMKFDIESSIESFAKRSAAPTLSSPSAGGTVHTSPVTFRWNDYLTATGNGVLEARNYHVQVARDTTFDNPVLDTDDVDMTRWTDPSHVLGDGVYYWRLQAIDESGNALTWSAARSFTLDAAPIRFHISSKNGLGVTRNIHVRSSESDLVGRVSQRTMRVFAVTSGRTVDGAWTKTGATRWTFNPDGVLVPGESYALAVKGGLRDEAGNAAVATARTVRTSRLADDRSRAFHYGSAWTRHHSSNAVRGTYSSGPSGAARVHVVGDSLRLYGCKGPKFGRVAVLVDGHHRTTVNEHQSFTECGVLLWKGSISSTATHTLKLRVKSRVGTVDAVRIG